MIKEIANSTTENRYPMSIKLHDIGINRAVNLNSGIRLPINKKLITMLEEMDVKFSVER